MAPVTAQTILPYIKGREIIWSSNRENVSSMLCEAPTTGKHHYAVTRIGPQRIERDG